MENEHDGDITLGMNSYYGDLETPQHKLPVTPKRKWGAHGTRYDEGCERCGRIGEVDNSSGLCARCGGGK